ncbi:MAG: mannosyltransferase [Cirrosporium novae-zelandiae]|nr:MAG: mannosyltransferase [Cirrosporium novae-zelandiae]
MLHIILGFAVFASTLFSLLLLSLPSYRKASDSAAAKGGNGQNNMRDGHKNTAVQVLVLGDIGRSPRMQYHALSIAKHGGHVDLIGYLESDPHPEIVLSDRISIISLPSTPMSLRTDNKLLFLLFGPLKVLLQIWYLWLTLGYRIDPAEWMLVQNPPSIPTLAIAQIVCFLRNTKLIIDWHNFGYSILAMKLGQQHPLVRISRVYERVFARNADVHLTVTDVMASVLKRDGYTTSQVHSLHDRPAAHLQPFLTPERSLSFLGRLPETASEVSKIYTGQMKVLVSSTSWTPDEDFSILLDALAMYSEAAAQRELPDILAIITGKGPLKDYYISQIHSLNRDGKLKNVHVKTAWLTMRDYASLLAAADLGVSLHTSSSGVDLPMKVVDMFGAGLPVVGWSKFDAWPELVKEGYNGRGFQSSQGLADSLVDLFGSNGEELRKLRGGALEESNRRWDQEWDPVLGQILGFNQ